jgi:hypothetical protein
MSRWICIDNICIPSDENDWDELVAFADAVAEQEPIDLVTCAECRFKRLYDDGETKYYYCALEDRPNRQWSVDDWNFCYWGERKEIE